MTSGRVRVEEVLVYLGLESEPLLGRLRAEGLFESEELEPAEAEELRVAAVLVEELGVNPAGVEVALHLRRRLLALEARARALAAVLEEARPKR
jgi:hypothetical protein